MLPIFEHLQEIFMGPKVDDVTKDDETKDDKTKYDETKDDKTKDHEAD